MRKNCHNCKRGYMDNEFCELSNATQPYFVCEKRDVHSVDGLEDNLLRPAFLEKAKRCCELKTVPLK